MSIPNIFPLVEGKGDTAAIQILTRRVLEDRMPGKLAAQPVDISKPWRVGHVQNLLKSEKGVEAGKWIRFLKAATRQGASAVLLVLDGDRLGGKCPADTARKLAGIAKQQGAGVGFSVAVVFAMQEIESWFIPDAEALLGGFTGHKKALRGLFFRWAIWKKARAMRRGGFPRKCQMVTSQLSIKRPLHTR